MTSNKQTIFKIISLTKKQPIIVYKNMENSIVSQQSEGKISNSQKSQTKKLSNVKQELQKITSKLQILDNPKIVYLEKRSQSCNLTPTNKGKTEQRGDSGDSKDKIQKNIKQYLRLAYKRMQIDKKSNKDKLPLLMRSNQQNQAQYQHQRSRSLANEYKYKYKGSIRKIGRRGKVFDQYNQRNQEEPNIYKPGVSVYKPQLISAWEDYSINDDF